MPDTILLVGNTTADRLTIQYALSDYVILTAHNTREALNKIQERHDIDLLILHPTVPAEEERQFIYTVRHMEEYKHFRLPPPLSKASFSFSSYSLPFEKMKSAWIFYRFSFSILSYLDRKIPKSVPVRARRCLRYDF